MPVFFNNLLSVFGTVNLSKINSFFYHALPVADATISSLFQCLKKALISFDSAYHIANMRISGRACKTNIPSNTSMRGLTGPQAILIMDNIVREIAGRVGLPLHKVCDIVTGFVAKTFVNGCITALNKIKSFHGLMLSIKVLSQ